MPDQRTWTKVNIHADGTVAFVEGGRRFRFEVLRAPVLRIWSPQPRRSDNVVTLGDRSRGGRPTSYNEVAAILYQLHADDILLMERIDGNFKTLADAIRARARKVATDDGWSDSTLRDHVRRWRASKQPPE